MDTTCSVHKWQPRRVVLSEWCSRHRVSPGSSCISQSRSLHASERQHGAVVGGHRIREQGCRGFDGAQGSRLDGTHLRCHTRHKATVCWRQRANGRVNRCDRVSCGARNELRVRELSVHATQYAGKEFAGKLPHSLEVTVEVHHASAGDVTHFLIKPADKVAHIASEERHAEQASQRHARYRLVTHCCHLCCKTLQRLAQQGHGRSVGVHQHHALHEPRHIGVHHRQVGLPEGPSKRSRDGVQLAKCSIAGRIRSQVISSGLKVCHD